MELYRNMQDTEGWQLVKWFMDGRIADHKNQLMTCPIGDVQKHRDKAQALESVLGHVDDVIERGMEMLKSQPP